ncbi:MAG: sulfite exporter TauE/SafE family protein, partial [Mesorhizobium sp.]|nr:sulfite exporter TauE/SafE family protein [Mesorhizobium sp.]
MSGLLVDPWFYAAAVPAVILTGLSKGGFGGAVGLIGVPMMALAMPPVQAAAILLPILCLMDVVSVWTWWGVYDRRTLVDMMPSAVVGIGLGWLTAAFVTEEMVRLIVGAVAIAFVLRWIYVQIRHGASHSASPNRVAAAFWGTIAGFTSF